MRAKVDEYRRENETVWPRAKRLSDCLRASVVTADAARTVKAYEALTDSGAFTVSLQCPYAIAATHTHIHAIAAPHTHERRSCD